MIDREWTASDEFRAGIVPSSYRSPPAIAGVVPREALVERLIEVSDEQLVVVTAPAGFGKTTTLALWEEANTRPFAWVHLDDLDNDPVHLLRHITVSIDRVAPSETQLTGVLTGAGSSPDLDMVPALVRALEDRAPIVLVLDDLHLITAADSLRALMGVIVGRAGSTQLVLAGRTASPLPLARYALTSGVFELTAEDLAMDSREAAQLLHHAGIDLAGDDIEALVRRTEGWPAGLHMAALRLGGRGQHAEALRFSGRDRLVADYLFEEVLNAQPAEMVDFLQRSAVLERMNADLLDELLERHDSAERLEQIERSGNMFLVPLDSERDWYRYHRLFGEMLRVRLCRDDPDLARALDLRASRLLEERGDDDRAIRHAARAGDIGRAADLIFARTLELVTEGRVALLGRWLDLLGADAMDHHVSAALAFAWYGDVSGDLDLLKRAMIAAEHSGESGPLADGSPSVSVAVAVLHALQGWNGVEGVLHDAQIVRDGGRQPENPWWAVGTVQQGTAYSMLGQPDLARQRFTEALEVTSEAPALEAPAVAQLALLALDEGDEAEADRLAKHALHLMMLHNLESVLPTIAVFPVAALVAARHGRRDEAERAAAAGRRMLARLQDLSPRTALLANLLLAKTALALGDLGEALTLAREAKRARRRDPSAVHLNEQLDDLLAQIDGSGNGLVAGGQTITTAQLRVLSYLPTHLSLQEIADQLGISRNTAKSHTVAVYGKLGVSSRSDAVRAAQRLGVLPG